MEWFARGQNIIDIYIRYIKYKYIAFCGMYHPLGFSLGIIFGDMCFYPSVLIHYRTPIPLEIAVDLKLICHKKILSYAARVEHHCKVIGEPMSYMRPGPAGVQWLSVGFQPIMGIYHHMDLSENRVYPIIAISIMRIMRINQWIFGYTISDPNDGKK